MAASMDDLKGRADACGYAQLLGIEVEELSPGYARTRVSVAPEHQNWMPRTHGALVMSLADHAWGLSFATLGTKSYVAVQLNVNYLAAPAVGDSIIAESRVIRAGETIGHAQVEVRDPQGKLIATALGTVAAVEARKPPESP
ncbi:MAG: PaaI family thioesterase [Dehalococcoidia bacterium]